ncbi:hypothetical protein D7X33_43665 [Butyricicoccus sp. 1XD8-22]|nr:hypothetical protein D7X33_43665 [Butyricicoccus sp. 1XD8-22]
MPALQAHNHLGHAARLTGWAALPQNWACSAGGSNGEISRAFLCRVTEKGLIQSVGLYGIHEERKAGKRKSEARAGGLRRVRSAFAAG